MRSSQAISLLCRDYNPTNVLDVGSGCGYIANLIRQRTEANVYTTDIVESDYKGDFNTIEFDRTFDCITAFHVLEHQLNVHNFLVKIFNLLEEDGVFVVSVPPLKHAIVGGHVSLWNPGLLLYNLIIAGFDCSKARVGTYDYDCSVIVRKKKAILPPLCYDNGDIDALSKFFPFDAVESFNGSYININWEVNQWEY
jgi:SAM-dependent methyltransferase